MEFTLLQAVGVEHASFAFPPIFTISTCLPGVEWHSFSELLYWPVHTDASAQKHAFTQSHSSVNMSEVSCFMTKICVKKIFQALDQRWECLTDLDTEREGHIFNRDSRLCTPACWHPHIHFKISLCPSPKHQNFNVLMWVLVAFILKKSEIYMKKRLNYYYFFFKTTDYCEKRHFHEKKQASLQEKNHHGFFFWE